MILWLAWNANEEEWESLHDLSGYSNYRYSHRKHIGGRPFVIFIGDDAPFTYVGYFVRE